MINPFQYLYGPVYSWRLGASLGIDPLSSTEKICNMNCVYCQLGLTKNLTNQRKVYVPTENIIKELERIPEHFVDYLTFSGRGEPTLAANLGEMIRQIKAFRHERVAIITNSLLISQEDVQKDLNEADFVLAKLDASDQESFTAIDGTKGSDFVHVVQGISRFRQQFKGKFALQIMLIDENLDSVNELAKIARMLNPDEVQLNTPLRPCPVKPIEPVEMEWAKKFFADMPVVSVWDVPQKKYAPMDDSATVKRHGNFRKTRHGF